MRFFILRPIFSITLAIFITLLGLIPLFFLRVEQFPTIVPPEIQVISMYPGASSETIATTITTPLEEAINGTENFTYMTSVSATGESRIRVFFESGTDIDKAQSNVQNRVNIIKSTLPEEVQRLGITVQKSSPTFIIAISLESPTSEYDSLFLSNYAKIHVVDELTRISGVSNVFQIGARDYSMRIWLNPDAMAEYALTTQDILKAVQDQNNHYVIGEIGRPPVTKNIELFFPVVTKGTFNQASEFENIILRSAESGAMVRLKDVANVELGAVNYDVIGEHKNNPAALMIIYQQYNANAIQVQKDVVATLERLSKKFPPGISHTITFDATRFIKNSIREVIITLIEATFLVIVIVFLFLQNWRTTIIPVLAMLISIIGTFAGLYILDLSINTLTLFGLILATGIVVDDAIVVVENVERNMRQKQLSALDASILTMKEVTGPVVAIVFILCAVFVPVAFVGGMTGTLYKQFAITISISVVISGIVALTLSPALSALLLKSHTPPHAMLGPVNMFFKRTMDKYIEITTWLMEKTKISLLFFGGVFLLTLFFFIFMPKTFIPFEDQGYLVLDARLPPAASLHRTFEVTRQINDIVLNQNGVYDIFSMTGWNLFEGISRSESGSYFVMLKDWNQRRSRKLRLDTISKDIERKVEQIPSANIRIFNPPPVLGLAIVSGIEAWIVDKSRNPMEKLEVIAKDFAESADKLKEMIFVDTNIETHTPQLKVNLDREKSMAYGVSVSEVNQALQAFLGSIYINNFTLFGRTFKVIMQGNPQFRSTISDIKKIFVRSFNNQMIPLDSLVTTEFSSGPSQIFHYNGYPAAKITGYVNPFYSSATAMKKIETIASNTLPQETSLAWSGESYEEKKSVNVTLYMFIGALVMVFLILAALYEKWTLPLVVVLVVPFGILGAFIAITLRGISNDIYFQIGLITLIALAAKNGILIVQFALIKQKEGLSSKEAALMAARLRLRAIVMTSLTFIVGVIPLVLSGGPGAASRHSVGTGVFGGMIFATFFGIFFVPVFYNLIERKK